MGPEQHMASVHLLFPEHPADMGAMWLALGDLTPLPVLHDNQEREATHTLLAQYWKNCESK